MLQAPATAAAGLEDLEDGSPQKQERQQEEQKTITQDSSKAVVDAAKPAAKKPRRSPSPAGAGELRQDAASFLLRPSSISRKS